MLFAAPQQPSGPNGPDWIGPMESTFEGWGIDCFPSTYQAVVIEMLQDMSKGCRSEVAKDDMLDMSIPFLRINVLKKKQLDRSPRDI